MKALNRFKVLALAAYVCTFSICLQSPAQELRFLHSKQSNNLTSFTLSGRVIDQNDDPVVHANVILRLEDNQELAATHTDSHGDFELAHPKTKSFWVEIDPGLKTRLADAIVENVPGQETRKLLLKLHKGFLVQGRIVAAGKGLRGLSLKVSSKENPDSKVSTIHSGGFTTTGLDGHFRLILTPGQKTINILNDSYLKQQQHFDYSFMVTSDTKLPDIELPDAGRWRT